MKQKSKNVTLGEDQWKPVSKLDKRKMRKYTSAIAYIHTLGIDSGAKSISNIAISPRTEKFLESLAKPLFKQYGNKSSVALGMEKLNFFPVTLQSAEDFVLYIRGGK